MKIITTNLKTTRRRQIILNNNNKTFTKKFGVHLVLVSGAWSLPWTVIDILSDTSVEKAGFPTLQKVSITNSFLVMVGLYFNPPFSMLGVLSSLNHCRSCKHY